MPLRAPSTDAKPAQDGRSSYRRWRQRCCKTYVRLLTKCGRTALTTRDGCRGTSGGNPMTKPHISYVDPSKVTDKAMLAEFERCAREGTPRPESQAIRAHVPAVFWAFANSWRDVFKNGVAPHDIKELCRAYVSRSVKCEYCGNQRSMKAAKAGVVEDDYRDLINFESSARYDERQKAALSYAEAITWDLTVGDEF